MQTIIYLQLLRYKIRIRLQFMVTCGYNENVARVHLRSKSAHIYTIYLCMIFI